MPNSEQPDHKALRFDAAKKFAQTMVVIDDEAGEVSAPEVGQLVTPSRGAIQTDEPETVDEINSQVGGRHSLDSKVLIETAMEHGLICSVLKPDRGFNFAEKALQTSLIADIVCLDWEIHKDGGAAACNLIKNIVTDDTKRNGRLRLIAIYTGDITNRKILERVIDSIPADIRTAHRFRNESNSITNEIGLRVVCLLKTHGVQLRDARGSIQVQESELPSRLLQEFSELSKGLLSNVALATIATIRNSTHHALAKFVGEMDGPYFHHRSRIENAVDAEDYAIEVILSELKNSIDRHKVSDEFASREAIRSRIDNIAGDEQFFPMKNPKKPNDKIDLPVEIVKDIVCDGLESAFDKHQNVLSQLGKVKPILRDELTSFFVSGEKEAEAALYRFAALTGVKAHAKSSLYQNGEANPALGLGSIVQINGTRKYLLCLQASCDSVRLKHKKAFLFIPLVEAKDGDHRTNIVHIVPDPYPKSGGPDCLALTTKGVRYSDTISIVFKPKSNASVIEATSIERKRGLFFKDTKQKTYRWIADLKHKRALRTVQLLGRDMGRLGFDEFEVFRTP